MLQWKEREIPKIPSLKNNPDQEKLNAVSRCTNKYLHKKFKKVVAFHSDDCESPFGHCPSPSPTLKWVKSNNNDTTLEKETETHNLQTSVSLLDEYKSNDEGNKLQSLLPLTSIYKPKFHKAASYVQDHNTTMSSTTELRPTKTNELESPTKMASTSTPMRFTPTLFTSGSCNSECQKMDELTVNSVESTSNFTRINQFVIPLVQNEPNIVSVSVPAYPTVTTNLDLQPLSPIVNYKFVTLPTSNVISQPKDDHMKGGVSNIAHTDTVVPFAPGRPVIRSLGETFLQYEENPLEPLKQKSLGTNPPNNVITMNYVQSTRSSTSENIYNVEMEEEKISGLPIIKNGFQRKRKSTDEYTCMQEKDPKYQLEREVARSLLSLSKMCHQTVSKQCAKAGLITSSSSPNPYAYTLSLNQNLLHTPTTAFNDKLEIQEKVTTNKNVTEEAQPGPSLNPMTKLKNESQSRERFYFDSLADRNVVPLEMIGENSFVERAKAEAPYRSSNSNSKENLVTETRDFASVITSVGSSNFTASTNVSKKLKTEFISPSSGPLTNILENGQTKCGVCHKIFSKPSLLKLHVNIHYFEQPFRCDSCAVSFRTKGHLHKHLGSNSHLNKVSLNSSSSQTSTNNPRPFKCDDCNIGFRIHGHLAKHLRSKMHITKLECLGKLPFGTYAEMERCSINMNDIDTTDCENSLQSLQKIAIDVIGLAM